jgi:hypothetical protein
LGRTIRQIARASAEDNGAVFAAVRPALVPLCPDSDAEGSQNPVTVRAFLAARRRSSAQAGGLSNGCRGVSDVLGRPAEPRPSTMVPARSIMSGYFVAPLAIHGERQARYPRPGDAHTRVRINIDGVLQLPKFRRIAYPS